MLAYIAEFLGTFMLILLGDGVVANVTLNKSGMKGAGSIQITFAWGLAVMIPAFIFGAAPGADHRPGGGRKPCMGHGSGIPDCAVCRCIPWRMPGISAVQGSV